VAKRAEPLLLDQNRALQIRLESREVSISSESFWRWKNGEGLRALILRPNSARGGREELCSEMRFNALVLRKRHNSCYGITVCQALCWSVSRRSAERGVAVG
jgi:hypothetical protein